MYCHCLISDISDHEVMLSFDVVSLFTAIPVNKACKYIRDKLNNVCQPIVSRQKHSIVKIEISSS